MVSFTSHHELAIVLIHWHSAFSFNFKFVKLQFDVHSKNVIFKVRTNFGFSSVYFALIYLPFYQLSSLQTDSKSEL